MSAFWYEGKPFEFNFSKVWTGVKTKFDCRETNAEKRPIKPFERTRTDLERMHFCAKNPGTFLVCLIEGSLRVQVNLTRISVLYSANFKFRHRSINFDGLRP